ncbi:alpha/beta hydrolase family esterase [Chitinophaga nivalis]|uniref:Uncharacterized protein n=1 Tax=Chitinophaga nivalis TaxID=2991709 RepID=A0ABT3IJN1_9BACT|nr:hypothetical protein [Chitinophaga nivalis]MCW3466142.1 hypothetical protein [Chitinophaga nivalis]MCW3484167.1 hypothetical protein [Chitinophaga nivalis]
MRKYICMLAIVAGLFSCAKDTSVYAPQQKETVAPGDLFNPDGPDQWPAGYLKAGINKVNLEVTMPNGDKVMREFKYYFPISLNPQKPISLVFNFHGSYTYPAGSTPPDPLLNVTPQDPLNRLADTANIITVFPAGTAEIGAVNWQFSEKHIPFVKAMVAFFKAATPAIDPNRIYTCGHSSGAIFSFVLAREMSEVFAAACPVSGQMKLTDLSAPPRTTAVRAFNGQQDASVNHAAAFENIKVWAATLGGYYAKDSIKGQQPIAAGNYTLLPTKWGGGNGNIEFYSIPEANHGINWNNIIIYMWEFMRANPLNKPTGLYIGVKQSTLYFTPGNTYTIPIQYARQVSPRIYSAPAGFDVSLNGNTLQVQALANAADGKIVVEGALNGTTKLVEVSLIKD